MSARSRRHELENGGLQTGAVRRGVDPTQSARSDCKTAACRRETFNYIL